MLWDRLENITTLAFTATSGQAGKGWNGKGCGNVEVLRPGPDTIDFRESGTWTTGEHELEFSNYYRWTRLEDSIQLAHLRYGPDEPVVLAELHSQDETHWCCQQAFRCNEDNYLVEVRSFPDYLAIRWRITGPCKDETIDYIYR